MLLFFMLQILLFLFHMIQLNVWCQVDSKLKLTSCGKFNPWGVHCQQMPQWWWSRHLSPVGWTTPTRYSTASLRTFFSSCSRCRTRQPGWSHRQDGVSILRPSYVVFTGMFNAVLISCWHFSRTRLYTVSHCRTYPTTVCRWRTYAISWCTDMCCRVRTYFNYVLILINYFN